MTSSEFLLGASADIPPNDSKQYRIELNGTPLELFVVNFEGSYYAYENRCPHVGVNLNWKPDQFLNFDQTHIQCTTHGAQFRIDNGLCEWGPCLGQSLCKLALRIEQDQLLLCVENPPTLR